ncbi:MAG: hypothetical protein M1832_003475 [Thelocarpon impressellum]|nr:MAG: hypothetical protein M1832_003475 [Thelocarpon impressellum]
MSTPPAPPRWAPVAITSLRRATYNVPARDATMRSSLHDAGMDHSDSNPPRPMRRSFTTPMKCSSPVDLSPLFTAEETLFSHEAAKIVSFTPSVMPNPVSAQGPLQIYQRRPNVPFLAWNRRRETRALLPKSQCWCVDGESKFALRKTDTVYYRIELPYSSEDDKKSAESLKTVLSNILQYEKTPCPFQRDFFVELDLEPTPVRIPWQPRVQPVAAESNECAAGPAENGEQEATVAADAADAVEHATDYERSDPFSSTAAGDDRATGAADDDLDPTDSTMATPRARVARAVGDLEIDDPTIATPTRPRGLTAGRAVTAPPQLTLQTSQPSKPVRSAGPSGAAEAVFGGELSKASSVDSFHSFPSTVQSFPPSPPDSEESSPIPIEGFEITVRRRRPAETTISGLEAAGALGDADHPAEESQPGMRLATRLKATRGARAGDVSPMPDDANLFFPPSPSSGRDLRAAILQKVVALLLGTPADLAGQLATMARSLARLVLRGIVFRADERRSTIPCQWVPSDDEGGPADDEDDFGVQLGGS